MILFDVANRADPATDAGLAARVAALQTYFDRDFGPVWGLSAEIFAVPSGGSPDPAHWLLEVKPGRSDVAGALAYHFDPGGQVRCEVYPEEYSALGLDWTQGAAHELAEAAVDPYLTETCAGSDGKTVLLEVCDAVAWAPAPPYAIGGFAMPNFVTPRWAGRAFADARFDFLGVLAAAAPAIASGGYVTWYDGASWRRTAGAAARPLPSRRLAAFDRMAKGEIS